MLIICENNIVRCFLYTNVKIFICKPINLRNLKLHNRIINKSIYIPLLHQGITL